MNYVYTACKILSIFIEVLLIFNLLILVHEIGHFLAAKWRGLVIEELGIWFGKTIWKKKIGGVNYSFGTIPFGGFVKLPQMVDMTAVEGKSESNVEELPKISALDKIIVAFAGPLFSFGLAFFFAVIVWWVGRPVGESEQSTTVGYVEPFYPAEAAKFQPGDQIVEINGHKVARWSGMAEDSINWCIVRSEGPTLEVKILRDGKPMTLTPSPIIPEKAHWWQRSGLRQIGILAQYTSIVDEVEPGSIADKAGFKIDDQILEINGQKLFTPLGIYDYMKDHPEGPYTLTVKRGEQTLQVPFTPGDAKIVGVPDFPNSPAKSLDLKVGDIVTKIDGKKLPGTIAMDDYIRNHPNIPITLSVERDGQEHDVKVAPQYPEHAPNNIKYPMIGVTWIDNDGLDYDLRGILTTSHPKPLEQIHASMMMILDTISAVTSPKSGIGVQQMGGPVMMMHAYYSMLDSKDGWKMALWFSVILNVNLALLNLLPIPVLDGGHILLAIIEAIRNRPMNLKLLEMIQGTCAVVLIGFMLYILSFDVQDLPFVPKPPPPISFKAPSTTP